MNPIVDRALAWAGEWFNPGMKAQCMNFVRHVLREAGSLLADKVTSSPVDGLWTGPGLASSLAGRDLGQLVTKAADLAPGDIVFWNDTYDEGWGPNVITHVGIYVGDGLVIHRPTVSRPVVRETIAQAGGRGYFRCALRTEAPGPAQAIEPTKPEKDHLKLWGHGQALSGQWAADPVRPLDSFTLTGDFTDPAGQKQRVELHCHSGRRRLRVGTGDWIDLDSLTASADYRP